MAAERVDAAIQRGCAPHGLTAPGPGPAPLVPPLLEHSCSPSVSGAPAPDPAATTGERVLAWPALQILASDAACCRHPIAWRAATVPRSRLPWQSVCALAAVLCQWSALLALDVFPQRRIPATAPLCGPAIAAHTFTPVDRRAVAIVAATTEALTPRPRPGASPWLRTRQSASLAPRCPQGTARSPAAGR